MRNESLKSKESIHMQLTLGFACLHLLVGCFLIPLTASVNYSEPITPTNYSVGMGQGFSTNYFKGFPPLRKYREQNIIDVYDAGFRNLRLRCRADLYDAPYNNTDFDSFLDNLETVVDNCTSVGVFPVISWIHHEAEAYATDEDLENYIIWWNRVAEKLKYKDFRLGFNLFTELGIDVCQTTGNCDGSLKLNSTKYNIWASRVVNEIRANGGNNDERILILGSPQKTSKGLALIDSAIYVNETYMIVEYHTYASGPNKKDGSPKYWEGNGTSAQRQTLLNEIQTAKSDVPLNGYFGAWMPHDNKAGALNQTEVENFAQYFVSVLKNESIPWSLNVLDVYYNTKTSTWVTDTQTIKGQPLQMSRVLDVIKWAGQDDVNKLTGQDEEQASASELYIDSTLVLYMILLRSC